MVWGEYALLWKKKSEGKRGDLIQHFSVAMNKQKGKPEQGLKFWRFNTID